MNQGSPTPFDHVGYRKLTESLRRADKRERDKSVIGFCEEVALLKACEDDLVILRGALGRLVDLLADPAFFALALDRGRAATGWYTPDQPDTSVEGLLVSTQDVPGSALATLLEASGFRCVSADDARPLIYLGKGNLTEFKRSTRSSEKVVRYDPPGVVVGGRAPGLGAGGDVSAEDPGSGPADPQAKPSGTPQEAAPSQDEPAPARVEAAGVEVEAAEPNTGNAYRIAEVNRPNGQTALPTTPDEVLEGLVEEIVSIEGPMGEELVARRLRSAYGQTSIRKSGRKRLTNLLKDLVKNKRLDQDEAGFYTAPGTAVAARSRTGIADDLVRATAHLPPAEIRAALTEVERDRPGLAGCDLVVEVAARLGFRLAERQVTDGPLGILIAGQLAWFEENGDVATSGITIPGDDGGMGPKQDDLPRAA